MYTTLTAKLNLVTTPEQFAALRQTHLAYRAALNQASQHAFAHGKTSNGHRLHRELYDEVRATYRLHALWACRVCRQVGATDKGRWTTWDKNVEARTRRLDQEAVQGAGQAAALHLAHRHLRVWTCLYLQTGWAGQGQHAHRSSGAA